MNEELSLICARIRIDHHPGCAVALIPDDVLPAIGQACLVAADFGPVYGTVAALPKTEAPRATHTFVRLADEADAATARENRRLAEEALERLRLSVCKEEVPVKLISATFSHSRDRLIVFVGAAEAVDLRRHTGPVQRAYNTRISIRLVGLREEAARIGGIGVCGRPTCCSAWMRSFPAVNVKMARIQDLPTSPQALNGACTRLKCCLSHENAFYRAQTPLFPEIGAEWIAPDGSPAKVVDRNLIARTIRLGLANHRFITVPLPERKEQP